MEQKITLRESLEDVKRVAPNGVFSYHIDSGYCRDSKNNQIHQFNLHLSDIYLENSFPLGSFKIEKDDVEKQGEQIVEIIFNLNETAEQLGVELSHGVADLDKRHYDAFESIVWEKPLILDGLHFPNTVRSRILQGKPFILNDFQHKLHEEIMCEFRANVAVSGQVDTGINENVMIFNYITATKNGKLFDLAQDKTLDLVKFFNFLGFIIGLHQKETATPEDIKTLEGN